MVSLLSHYYIGDSKNTLVFTNFPHVFVLAIYKNRQHFSTLTPIFIRQIKNFLKCRDIFFFTFWFTDSAVIVLFKLFRIFTLMINCLTF